MKSRIEARLALLVLWALPQAAQADFKPALARMALPEDWSDVGSVDLYRIAPDGCVPMKTGLPITDGNLVLSLGSEEGISIVPAGAKPAPTGPSR